MMVADTSSEDDISGENGIEIKRKELIAGAIHYVGVYKFWYNPTFLAFRVFVVSKFKVFQASGSTATLLMGAAAYGMIPFVGGAYAVTYALLGAFITGWITEYSRCPSIRQKMRNLPLEVKHEFEDLTWRVWFFKEGIHGCALASSFCVFLSAFLSGKTLVKLLVGVVAKAIGTTQLVVLPLSMGIVFSTAVALLTGFSAWYSFYAYSIVKADKFAVDIGNTYQKYLMGEIDQLPRMGAAFWGTIISCFPILVTSTFGGFYFVTHALSAIATTFGLSFLTPYVIKCIAGAFIIPSLVTTVTTKVGDVYKFINGSIGIYYGERDWPAEYLEVIRPLQKLMGYKINRKGRGAERNRLFMFMIMLLAGISVIDLYHSGIGAWLAGYSFSRNVVHIDLSEFSGWKQKFVRVLLLTLAASETLQNIAFTILPMLQDLIAEEMRKIELLNAIRESQRPDPEPISGNFSHYKA